MCCLDQLRGACPLLEANPELMQNTGIGEKARLVLHVPSSSGAVNLVQCDQSSAVNERMPSFTELLCVCHRR